MEAVWFVDFCGP